MSVYIIQQKKAGKWVIGISILIHLLFLLWFLGSHHLTQISKTQLHKKNITKTVKTKNDEWASTTARRGAPVYVYPSHQTQQTTPDKPISQITDQIEQAPSINKTKEPADKSENKLSTTFLKAARTALARKIIQNNTKNSSCIKKTTEIEDEQKNTMQKKQEPTQPIQRQLPSLAQIAHSFMAHAREDGEHTITITGDPRKLPTDQQLKRHHYLEKIHWCLHNSSIIMRTNVPIMSQYQEEPIITLLLHRDGSISDMHVTRSSTNVALDSFFVSLFEDASKSFPPLPSHFTHDPYRMNWVIKLN